MKQNRSNLDSRALALAVFVALACIAMVALYSSGCATSPHGLAVESKWYQSATNANVIAGTVATSSASTPWGAILALATTAASGLLGMWSSSLHKRLNVLEGGAGGAAGTKGL
jgi:hypothetical protein